MRPIDTYRNQLERLSSVLKPPRNTSASAKLASIENERPLASQSPAELLEQILLTRDAVDKYLETKPDQALSYLIELTELDDQLYGLGRAALRRKWINFSAWRNIRKASMKDLPIEQHDLGWWWYLDEPSFEHSARFDQTRVFSLFVGGILCISILMLFLGEIISTAQVFSSFVLSQFAGIDTSQLGFDLFTVGAIALQIVFVGRVALGFARQMTTNLNRLLQQYSGWGRQILMRFLPLSSLFVGTATFLIIIWLMNNLLFPQLYRVLINRAETPEDFDEVSLLARDNENPLSLTSLGIRFEQAGNMEEARRRYEQALNSDPTLIFARYRLAGLYIGFENYISALGLLDEGLNQLTDYRVTLTGLPLDNVKQAKQLQYLFLLRRAQTFLKMNEPQAALIDLREIENKILGDKPDALELFITLENADNPPFIAQRTTEFYYYLALTYDQLAIDAEDPNFQTNYKTRAVDAWRKLQRLANSKIGLERLWLLEANDRLKSNTN